MLNWAFDYFLYLDTHDMRNERESNIMKAPCKTVSVLLVNALDLTKAGHVATFQFQRLKFGSGVILSEKNFKLTAELKSF